MFGLHSASKWLRGHARRTTRPITSRRFRPTLEALECRLTPASTANVVTSMASGTLTLTDSGTTSSLTLSQPAANEITITPDANTTINGKAGPVTITGVTSGLNVNLGSVNDTLTFDLSKNSFSIGSVSITATTGSQTVQTNAAGTTNFLNVTGNLSENLGSGFEFETLHQFNVSGNMTIDHANGNLLVFLGVDSANLGKLFNSVGGSLSVANMTSGGKVGTGFDVDALEETNVIGNIAAQMGKGDSTGFSGWTSVGSLSNKSITVGGNVSMAAPSGFLAFGDFANDGEEVVNAKVAGNVTMDLGRGAGNTALFGNGASQSSTSANNVTITGSGSHDSVTIGPSVVHNNLSVSLNGAGGNSTSLDDAAVTGGTSLMSAGGGSTIAIDNLVPGSTFGGFVGILMTGSDNLLAIDSHTTSNRTTTFDGPVFANLGSGGDTLILAEAGKVDFKTSSAIDGGAGTNHAVVNHHNIEGVQPSLNQF